MKAFVTGATGFVGSHVARELANQGADLRLLVRASSPTRNIEGLHAERVVGDLREAGSLRAAIAGCDVVFHVAADYRLWTRDAADMQSMYRSNVEGTRALIDAARQAGVRVKGLLLAISTLAFAIAAAGRSADSFEIVAGSSVEEVDINLKDIELVTLPTGPVLDVYRLWRPTPLYRARRLEAELLREKISRIRRMYWLMFRSTTVTSGSGSVWKNS